MAMTEYPVGRFDNIGFVVIFTRYQGKWVYCWHKRRESYEHPGGHVEPNETPMQAAKRELFEETGIKDCTIIPCWDYEFIWENGVAVITDEYSMQRLILWVSFQKVRWTVLSFLIPCRRTIHIIGKMSLGI